MATDEVWEQLLDKAEFCLLTGIAPSEYDEMTDLERDAFIQTANKIAEKRK